MNIGLFDSGLGGLTILKEFIRLLPQYDYIYLGDNAYVPYGGRSEKLIYKRTLKAVDFLFRKNCFLIVLACNTATATSLKKIQQEYLPRNYPSQRVLGIILPTVESVIENLAKRVGVIGTYATIISRVFEKELKKLDSSIKVFQNTCPLLVPVIEEGEYHWEGLDLLLEKYINPLKKQKIDSLILGCTHYGLIEDKIQSIVGNKIKVVSEGPIAASKLKIYLSKHKEIKKKLSKNRKREYFVTDLNDRYVKMAKLFMGKYFCNGEKFQLTTI